MAEEIQPDCCYYDCQSFNQKYKRVEGQFSAIHLNMRSIKNKADTLEIFLQSLIAKFSVIILTETWLTKEDIPPHLLGYKCETVCREEKRGGGIAIYLKDNLQCQIMDDFTRMNENVESLFVKVSNTIVAALYRPPSGNMQEFMYSIENAFCVLGSKPFIILGDVNIDTISNEPHAREFRDVIHQYACYNMITLPTRITTDTATSLDVCLTNIESNNITAGAILYDISDHLPIFCLGSFFTSKDNRYTERVLHRKINEETLGTFSDLIGQENWDDVYTENDPVLAYRKFLVKFKHSYDVAFPLCESRLRPKKIRKPWVTSDLYKKIKQKTASTMPS